MPDVFANITQASEQMLAVIADVLELRAALPQQQAMLKAYLADISFPPGARVLEVGCGTGPVTRVLAAWPNVSEVVGVDPSAALLEKARALSAALPAMLTFQQADGRALPFPDGSFDVAILHTVLTHVPGPEVLLAEAFRVLRRNGSVGICDGDFATATVATGDNDPLQSCVEAFVDGFVHDRWLVRRLTSLVQKAGFKTSPPRSYGLIETADARLTPTWVERGADAQVAAGRLNADAAAALKMEARRRVSSSTWFGYMAYASLIGRKSD